MKSVILATSLLPVLFADAATYQAMLKAGRLRQPQPGSAGAQLVAEAGSPAAAMAASPMAAPAAAPEGALARGFNYGDPKCPCVGLSGLEGVTQGKIAENVTVAFPADLGARCDAWDNGVNPISCLKGQDPGKDNGWCEQPWCYVDPCNCEIDEPATKSPEDGGYLPGASYQGNGLWYSYRTCGGIDYWMPPEKKKKQQEEPKTCAEKKDEDTWGDVKCQCVGLAGQNGTTNMTISPGLEIAYPAETGASCDQWDLKRHPDCKGKDPPSWCEQSWCYVDPCNCRISVAPKTSAYLEEAFVNGRPVYYSYATCGGTDEFAATNEKACVNLKSKKFCHKNKKCAWNGEECLGKELVTTCTPATHVYHSGVEGFTVLSGIVWALANGAIASYY
eukprot:TRINITY_DN1845_c1_g1_i1.p1 TRINITY_DN1845_c1_g1~~TRINITY_DN1845_c1_g1_i1.p1  ORF type:complete len:390 (-),score=93.03 TRINITY_DN1845_c1_g1_i1:175-1344(-)